MTHPFHPWHGRVLEFVTRKRAWGEDRVYCHDDQGRLVMLPTGWTDVADLDPFVIAADGRCPFRLADLQALADLSQRLRSRVRT